MIRLADPKDANQAMDLVMIVLEDMELNVFNQLPKTKIKELLIQGFIEKPTYRYGHYGRAFRVYDCGYHDCEFVES
ncbi:hypothetical protein FJV53_24115 [Salmonella enterica subsp. enterica serovar Typhimurium]|uniref:hypothetical protein n=1 Tax=Salmonella enterica TaxID=28901 RepID=UPI0011293B61|nr:hypothetical protein [Salmonella enterica]TPO52334.1 hypothetical protein FJV53_24115 [Salmonella enterica subsp. enterica serovar Typhimurium]